MFILFFILWMILNSRITLEVILFGIAVSGAGCLFAGKLLGYRFSWDKRLLKNLPLLILYLLILIREIVMASLMVMKEAFSPQGGPDPVIVEFDTEFKTGFQNVLLANSITLTPGTYTLLQQDNHFVVHCLRASYAEGIEESVFVKLLRKFSLS
ncbi:MAG: Na+/H+ antiporter subunit E [Lachnospiraceae bacterium]|nr:Na+/H+ antiporter subunit E [Lachnospiraceae bacterium]